MATLPMTGLWTPNVFAAAGHDIDLSGVGLKAALMLNPFFTGGDIDTETGWADVSVAEVTGTGYTAGGQLLSNPVLDLTGGRMILTADNLQWPSSTISGAAGVVVYDPNGTSPVAAPLVAVYKFDSIASNAGGLFEVPWPATPAPGTVFAVRNPGVA